MRPWVQGSANVRRSGSSESPEEMESKGSSPHVPKMDVSASHDSKVLSNGKHKHRKSESARRRKKARDASKGQAVAEAAGEAVSEDVGAFVPRRQRTGSVELLAQRREELGRARDTAYSVGGASGAGGALGFLSLIPSEYHAPPQEKMRHSTVVVGDERVPSPRRQPEPLPDLSKGLTFGFMDAGGGARRPIDDGDGLQPESGEFDPQMAAEGWLKRRVKAGKWKEVWCTLNFSGMLKEHKGEDTEEATKTIKVSSCTIAKDALTRLAFRLKQKSKTLIYQAPDNESFAIWLPSLAQYTHEMFTTLEIGSLSFPTMVCNQRCIIVRANREAERLLGYHMKEMVGRHLSALVATQREEDSNEGLLRCISKGQRELKSNPTVRLTHLSGEPLDLTMDLGRYTEAKHGDKYIIAFKLASNKKRLDLDAVRGVKISWLTAETDATKEDEFMKSQAKLHKFFGD